MSLGLLRHDADTTYDDVTSQNTTTDGDEASEWAFLVDVAAIDGRLWRTEAQSDILYSISFNSARLL
jgi:hypothetical protein